MVEKKNHEQKLQRAYNFFKILSKTSWLGENFVKLSLSSRFYQP